MIYLFLERSQMTDDGNVYHYSGLDMRNFIEIRYNEEATQAVVKTTQQDIPVGIQEITEAEFNQYTEQWPQPVQPNPSQHIPQGVTLQELSEKIDLLTMMQLEKEGIL